VFIAEKLTHDRLKMYSDPKNLNTFPKTNLTFLNYFIMLWGSCRK